MAEASRLRDRSKRRVQASAGDAAKEVVGTDMKSLMAAMTSAVRSSCGLWPARSMIRSRAFGMPAASRAWLSGGKTKSSRPGDDERRHVDLAEPIHHGPAPHQVPAKMSASGRIFERHPPANIIAGGRDEAQPVVVRAAEPDQGRQEVVRARSAR